MAWWRAYDEALDDPKVQRLRAEDFRGWFNLMCLTSRNGGCLPELADIAFALRMDEKRASALIETLKHGGLLDQDETLHPHNWNGRQYKNDVSSNRVKAFRERQRKRDETVSETANGTPPETEQRQKQSRADPEATASDAASAPSAGSEPIEIPLSLIRTEDGDWSKPLFRQGLGWLAKLYGTTPAKLRSLVGQWKVAAGDDCKRVFDLMAQAQRDAVADPKSWITAALNGKPSVVDYDVDAVLAEAQRAVEARRAQ